MSDPFDVLKLDLDRLERIAADQGPAYREAEPFEHAIIDDFLPQPLLQALLDRFPGPDDPVWLDWTKRDQINQPRKQGIGDVSQLYLKAHAASVVLSVFNSAPFVRFVETLTGIPHLCTDPYFQGGGMHQILTGGKLNVHSDFNHHARLGLYRRINVLIYLNPAWDPAYGGHLELWDRQLEGPVVRVLPILNRCVIFNTRPDAFHGHPEPLASPDGTSRRSIALYYYTAEPWPGDDTPRQTEFRVMS